jgi:hypothetical protein
MSFASLVRDRLLTWSREEENGSVGGRPACSEDAGLGAWS